jgi:endonuclease IV
MTIIEMKSVAYDLIAQIEHCQKQLAEINKKIAEESTKQTEANDTKFAEKEQ